MTVAAVVPAPPFRRVAHLSLGGNLGDRAARLAAALPALAARGVEILRVSPIYETAPMYLTEQPAFLNMAVTVAAAVTPEALLSLVQAVERDAGRLRASEPRNGPRTLDIDIVMTEDTMTTSPELTLPHPRLAERAFVLAPLADIAGTAVPPGWSVSIDEALDRAGGRADVRRFAPPPAAGAIPSPLREEDVCVMSLRDFTAVLPGGGGVRMDLKLRVLHPGRRFRDDITAVMSYEDIVLGLRRICARAAPDAEADLLALRAGDLCLGFPQVLGAEVRVTSDRENRSRNFVRQA